MRRAAVISALFHVVVIVIAFFGLPNLFSPDPMPEQPIAVDVVMVEPKMAVKTAKMEPPKAKPKPKPKQPPKPARMVPPPPPPMAAVPEPAPPPPKAKPIAKPKPKPKPKLKAKAKPKPKPKPKPRVVRKAPKPKAKPKPPPDRFQALLKNLAKQSQQQRTEEKRKAEPQKKPDIQVASAPPPSTIDRRRLAAGLAQLVEQQIRQCWNIPGGAKDVAEMKIEVRIRLGPDGSLRGAPQIADERRMQADQVFRTVAESALRALRNPRCTPLRLPYAQYDIWKDITLNFDPRKALGQ